MDNLDVFLQLLQSQGTQNPTEAQPVVTPGSDVLQNEFFNTPAYQLLFGTQNKQLDPTERFQADPGFQYNMDQALKQVQNMSAARGLLESGITQRDLLGTAQGLQNQQYGNWLQRQGGLFTDYQNQLNGTMQFGAGQSGAPDAMQLGALLGQGMGQMEYGTGQGIGQAQLGTGENISSLLGNLGYFNANAQLSTGAARASTLMNTLGMQAQAQNAAQGGQVGTMNSQLQGIGSLLGGQAAGWGGQQAQTGFGGGSDGRVFRPEGYF